MVVRQRDDGIDFVTVRLKDFVEPAERVVETFLDFDLHQQQRGGCCWAPQACMLERRVVEQRQRLRVDVLDRRNLERPMDSVSLRP